jgi:hypothetical protein
VLDEYAGLIVMPEIADPGQRSAHRAVTDLREARARDERLDD